MCLYSGVYVECMSVIIFICHILENVLLLKALLLSLLLFLLLQSLSILLLSHYYSTNITVAQISITIIHIFIMPLLSIIASGITVRGIFTNVTSTLYYLRRRKMFNI